MTTTAAGTLTLQLTLPSDVFVAGIATSSCTVAPNSGCRFLDYSEPPSTGSSKTLTAPNAGAGNYVVIFANLGPASESLTYLVTLMTS